MTETTIFLAKLWSLYFVITGLAMLFNRKYYLTAAAEMLEHKGLSFFTSLFTLISGILLVLFHNVWVASWPVIITVLAWLTLIKGVLRLFLPVYFEKCMRAYEHNGFFYTVIAISILIGLWLGCYGFY